MRTNRGNAATILFWLGAFSLALAMARPVNADGPTLTEEFFDTDFGYSFKYPADWKIDHLPKDVADPDVRVTLQGPNGSSFMVVVDKIGKVTSQENFKTPEERKERVEKMMSQTIDQIYKSISQNIKAAGMTVGERRDLSNDRAIKFYVATLHHLEGGKAVIVAGIHSFPFGKNYSINFLMTAFYDPKATKDQVLLREIFNSFRLLGEEQSARTPRKADAPADQPDGK